MISYVNSVDSDPSNIVTWYTANGVLDVANGGSISRETYSTQTSSENEYEDGSFPPYSSVTSSFNDKLGAVYYSETFAGSENISYTHGKLARTQVTNINNSYSGHGSGGAASFTTYKAVRSPGTNTVAVTQSGTTEIGPSINNESATAIRNLGGEQSTSPEKYDSPYSGYSSDGTWDSYTYGGVTDQDGTTSSSSASGENTITSSTSDPASYPVGVISNYTHVGTTSSEAINGLQATANIDRTIYNLTIEPASFSSVQRESLVTLRYSGFPSTVLGFTSASINKTYTLPTLTQKSTRVQDRGLTTAKSEQGSFSIVSASFLNTSHAAYPLRTKEIGFSQQKKNQHVVEYKNSVNNYTHFVYKKYSELVQSVHSKNTEIVISPKFDQKSVEFTNITYSSSTKQSATDGSSFTITENFYNGVLEDPIMSNNYETYQVVFDDYTSTYSEHTKFSECVVLTTTDYMKSYTGSYVSLSAFTRSLTVKEFINGSTARGNTTLTLGSTSESKTFSYLTPKRTSFARIAPEFVNIVNNYSGQTTDSFTAEGGSGTTSVRYSVGEVMSKAAFTSAPIYVEHARMPYYSRPGVVGCIYEDFPDAYAGFVVGTFNPNTIKKFYATTRSQVIQGNVPKDFGIDGLNVVYLAGTSRGGTGLIPGPPKGLRGITKNYFPANNGLYPQTYFDFETRQNVSVAGFSTSLSSNSTYPVINVLRQIQTTFGSTVTTCHTTDSVVSQYTFSVLETTTEMASGYSNIKFRNGIQTSAIINAVFTSTNGTFPTTSSKSARAPNITQTILFGGSTRSVILTNSQQDVYTTTKREASRINEYTVKIKVYVDDELPDNFIGSQYFTQIYFNPVDGKSIFSFLGGYNAKGGKYSVYTPFNYVSVTQLDGTRSVSHSRSAYTNITFSIDNGNYFAMAVEPMYVQSMAPMTGRKVPEFLTFNANVQRPQFL